MKTAINIVFIQVMIIAFAIMPASLVAQEPAAPADHSMPKDHLVRSQFDGMMNREINMITDFYDAEIEIILYPNVEVAKGIEAARKYWTTKFSDKKEFVLEMEDLIDLGNKAIGVARKVDHTALKTTKLAIIIELKGDKISRLVLIE